MIDATAIWLKVLDQLPTILTILGGFVFQWRTGKRREARTVKRADTAAASIKADVAAVKNVADETHRIGNSAHDELTRIKNALGGEVERVAAGGSPTPKGEPSDANPVTVKDNVATVEKKQ